MNKKEFEKLVRPYLTTFDYPQRQTLINKELILQDFESREPERVGYIIEENKLVFIPFTVNKVKENISGMFIFSDDSKMYCWTSRGAIEKSQSWYETYSPIGWNSEATWILVHYSMSSMNKGKGWNYGSNRIYYVLEIPKLKFINWTNNNPMEVKV